MALTRLSAQRRAACARVTDVGFKGAEKEIARLGKHVLLHMLCHWLLNLAVIKTMYCLGQEYLPFPRGTNAEAVSLRTRWKRIGNRPYEMGLKR